MFKWGIMVQHQAVEARNKTNRIIIVEILKKLKRIVQIWALETKPKSKLTKLILKTFRASNPQISQTLWMINFLK